MSLEQTACEGINKVGIKAECRQLIDILVDLKAFERRLTEVIACLHPSTTRWRSKYYVFKLKLQLLTFLYFSCTDSSFNMCCYRSKPMDF